MPVLSRRRFSLCAAVNWAYSCAEIGENQSNSPPISSGTPFSSVKVSAGAGFVVALSGDIMTMPGLPKVPAAVNIDVTDDGKITGLF